MQEVNQTQQGDSFVKGRFVVLWAGVSLGCCASSIHADTFGSGGEQFDVDFVSVGNAGNADDAGAGGGIYSSPYGGHPCNYRISTCTTLNTSIAQNSHD